MPPLVMERSPATKSDIAFTVSAPAAINGKSKGTKSISRASSKAQGKTWRTFTKVSPKKSPEFAQKSLSSAKVPRLAAKVSRNGKKNAPPAEEIAQEKQHNGVCETELFSNGKTNGSHHSSQFVPRKLQQFGPETDGSQNEDEEVAGSLEEYAEDSFATGPWEAASFEDAAKRQEFDRMLRNQTTESPSTKVRQGVTQRRATSLSDSKSDDEVVSPGTAPRKLIPISIIDAYMKDDDTLSDIPHLGPYLLKLAKLYASGDNPVKALQYSTRAVKFYEKYSNASSSLDLVLSLHILAALHCRLGQYEDAVHLLQHSVTIPDLNEGEEHALAKFAGHMQLGDTLNLVGKQGTALQSYHAALEVQKVILGDLDPRVGENCHYIAEAHLQAMEFPEAEALCEHALAIHNEHGEVGSLEEARDRQLLALIYSAQGDHEKSLDNLEQASATFLANEDEIEVAAVNSSIGDALLALGRDLEAELSYQKALEAFKALKGDNHALTASVYVRLAELYLRTNKPRDAKTYCECALRIYREQEAEHAPEDIVQGLTGIAAVLEQLNEEELALRLLQRALKIQDSLPGQQVSVGGIEAQMAILYHMMKQFPLALDAFKSAALKLRDGGVRNTALLGMLLNQTGVTFVELGEIQQAASLFEEAKSALEDICGAHHLDTIDVCSNLAGAYDVLGRLEDAIKLLEVVVRVKEEKLGTVHPDAQKDRHRLQSLLKDVDSTRRHKSGKLHELPPAVQETKTATK